MIAARLLGEGVIDAGFVAGLSVLATVAACVIVTAILAPIVTARWANHLGYTSHVPDEVGDI